MKGIAEIYIGGYPLYPNTESVSVGDEVKYLVVTICKNCIEPKAKCRCKKFVEIKVAKIK